MEIIGLNVDEIENDGMWYIQSYYTSIFSLKRKGWCNLPQYSCNAYTDLFSHSSFFINVTMTEMSSSFYYSHSHTFSYLSVVVSSHAVKSLSAQVLSFKSDTTWWYQTRKWHLKKRDSPETMSWLFRVIHNSFHWKCPMFFLCWHFECEQTDSFEHRNLDISLRRCKCYPNFLNYFFAQR